MIVISDRFVDSTRIYQGLRGAGLRETVDRLHDLIIGVEPDLTFLIDIDPGLGLSRARGRQGHEERFEDMGLAMQERMRAGFLELARSAPARIRVIDGNRDADSIAAEVAALARAALP